jgi:threonine/homoserine/homoserine lactone efflux protein
MPGLKRLESPGADRGRRETLPLSLVAFLGFCLVATLAALILTLWFGVPEFTSPPPDR